MTVSRDELYMINLQKAQSKDSTLIGMATLSLEGYLLKDVNNNSRLFPGRVI